MSEISGLHLMLDGYGCDRTKLGDVEFVRKFLDEFPEDIGMTKVMSPYVSRFGDADRERWGLSGFVLIAESHVSIHTFPEDGVVSVDVFSCRKFEIEAAEIKIVREFGIKTMYKSVFDRGTEYANRVNLAEELLQEERHNCVCRIYRAQASPSFG